MSRNLVVDKTDKWEREGRGRQRGGGKERKKRTSRSSRHRSLTFFFQSRSDMFVSRNQCVEQVDSTQVREGGGGKEKGEGKG